jgi:hypothetical protein
MSGTVSKERVAQCLCGSLRASASGDPLISYLCHCATCQRRSGAAVHFGAYFIKGTVKYSGPSKIYSRVADSGFAVHHHFCPDCGSTVYWETDKYPDRCGIAVGCFADPKFPAPTLSMWEESKHHWLLLPSDIDHLHGGLGVGGVPMTQKS